MSTRARATSMRAIRHGARKLTARARAVRALLSTGTKGRIPALWSDAGWFRDRARTQPWVYPQDLEQQVQWVDDLTGQPRGWSLGANILTNGDFSSGVSGWLEGTGGTLTVVSGVGRITNSSNNGRITSTVFSTTPGNRYTVRQKCVNFSGAYFQIQVRDQFGSGTVSVNASSSNTGVLIADFVASANSHTVVSFAIGSAGGWVEIDNITVQEVILDQSWLGPELVTTYASGGAYGNYNGMSLAGTVLTASAAPSNGYFARFPVTAGRSYLISLPTSLSVSGGTWQIQVYWSANGTSLGGIVANFPISSTSCPFAAPATAVSCEVIVQRSAASSGGATDTCTGFVGFSVRELPGHPSVSPSAGNGPTATARVNLLQRTEDLTVSPWTNALSGTGLAATVSTSAGTSPLGTAATRVQLSLNGGTTTSDITRRAQPATPSAVSHKYSVWMRSTDGVSTYNMHIVGAAAATTNVVVTGTWTRFEVVAVGTGSSVNFGVGLRGGQTPANSNTADVLVWGADLRLSVYDSLNLPAYQSVGDGSAGVFDYDWQRFPVRLVRGAANRGLMTLGTLDLTGTDAVNAGMFAIQTATGTQILLEMSANAGSTTGTMYLSAETSASVFASRGSGALGSSSASLTPPTISALLGSAKISTPVSQLTRNGVSATPAATSQGTGNYGNLRLFEGGRSLDSSPSLSFTGEWLPGFVCDANGVPADLAAEVLREYAAAVNFYY